MKSMIPGLLATALLAGPTTADALVVTWDIRGAIDASFGEGWPDFPGASAGDPFQVLLSFDTNATQLRADNGGRFAPGARYQYDPASLSATVVIGSSVLVEYRYDPTLFSLIFMRDNAGDVTDEGIIDGFTFGIGIPIGSNGSLGIIMRGTVLDIVNGPGLPAVADPRLADLELYRFQIFADGTGITGEIFSVRNTVAVVPEPGTFALLGLGLMSIGLSLRRKAL